MALVLLPCDLPTWPTVQRHLTRVKDVQNADQLIDILHRLHNLCNIGLDPDDTPADPTRFDGLRLYVSQLTPPERDRLFRTTLPCMVNYALKLKILKPLEGLRYSLQQQGGTIELDRRFIASLVANSFFCTFPKRSTTSHPTLLDANFSSFFYHLPRPWQRAKLEAILFYFEALSEAEPLGTVSYTRKVMSGRQFVGLDDWLACGKPLCPVVVRDTGRIEDAEPGVCQVCFLSPLPGGTVLRDGRSQEALCYSCYPEQLASLLFQERLEDNEALAMSGCLPSCHIQPDTDGHLRANRLSLPARIGESGVTICGLDAENYCHLPAAQCDDDAILRELNKAYLGFQQPRVARRLSPIGESGSPSPRKSCSPVVSEASCSPVVSRVPTIALEDPPVHSSSERTAGSDESPVESRLCRPAALLEESPSPVPRGTRPVVVAALPKTNCSSLREERPDRPAASLRRPATIGASTLEETADDSRAGVLRLIGQLQQSIERELATAGQQANTRIVSQLLERIRTMERSQLVQLLSRGSCDAPPADAAGEDVTLLTVCEALMHGGGEPLKLQCLDDDYFAASLEEVTVQRCEQQTVLSADQLRARLECLATDPALETCPRQQALHRHVSSESDFFYSARTSMEKRRQSQDDDLSSGSPPRYRDSLTPERAPAPLPRRRSTFKERLREANRRAAREEKAASSEGAAGVESEEESVTRIEDPHPESISSEDEEEDEVQEASEDEGDDEVPDQLPQDRCWIRKARGKSRSQTGNSSRLSFSSDFSSDMEELCDKFGHWLEEPAVGELGSREMAVMRLTQQMLKRTLSDSFAGVALDIESLDTSQPLPRIKASSDGDTDAVPPGQPRTKRPPVRSLSLTDQRARERLALEVAKKLVDPATSRQCVGSSGGLKYHPTTVVEIVRAADHTVLRTAAPPVRLSGAAVCRFSEQLATLLLADAVPESALQLDFHKAKHRRAYRKISAVSARRPLAQFQPPPVVAPPSLATGGQLDADTVEGFSWTLAERLLEDTLRQLPSPRPRSRLLDRLISGRAHSLDRRGILKKPRRPPALQAAARPEPAGPLRSAQSRSLPDQLHRLSAASSVGTPRQPQCPLSRHQAHVQSRGVSTLECREGVRPVATGNWGCGSGRAGDPQLKAMLQWLAASRAELPCLIYYTCGQPAVRTLQWVCRSIADRQWTVGELAGAIISHCQKRLDAEKTGARRKRPDSVSMDLFERLLRWDRPPAPVETSL